MADRPVSKRPTSVTVLGWLYVAVGSASLVKGGVQIAGGTFEDVGWILASGALAVLGGACLLRGRNWARWLCAAWMGGHVYVGYLHSTAELVIHALFLAIIVAILWRPASSAYFARARG